MSQTLTLPRTSRRLKEQEEQKTKKQPPYHVILLNDDDHSFDYVIAMLQQLFGHPREKGFQMAWEVHTPAGHCRYNVQRTGRAEARPDSRLRPRSAHPALQRLDVGNHRAGPE